ncbi:MAG: PilZ domain-containing protein [Leptospiraceae bacterium]|nr:PilZ domain-containing protein [Leptospiraceae bacterium]MCP5495000.1 PilZ domain-containing protein [Leptospiraceae bacterium]
MKTFSYGLIKFHLLDKHILEKQNYAVSIPVSLNILGKTYNLNTSVLTPEYVYIKIYIDDFDLIPEVGSDVLIFITMNFFAIGLIELSGKMIGYKELSGKRLGIWIKYEDISDKDKKRINNFIFKYYAPRYSVRFEVSISKHGFQGHYKTQAINLSKNGIFVEGEPGLFSINDKCNLVLYPQNSQIEVMGEVTWINKGKLYDKPNGYGLKFIHNKFSRKKISKYTESLVNKSELIR